MYFRLKNCDIIPEGVNYFEVDYPESVKRKDARIFKSSYLRSFFHKRNVIKNDIFVYNDGRFTLVGCDMIQVNELLGKEFCSRGRGLSAATYASHSSITNFLTQQPVS